MVRCQTPLEMKAVPAVFRAVTNQDRGETVWESCPQHVSGYAAVKKPASPMMTREAITPELLEARSRPRQVSAQLRERPS